MSERMKTNWCVLCVPLLLLIGVAVLAVGQHADATSVLSDQEMAKYTGTCGCKLKKMVDCRAYGELECVLGPTCATTGLDYTNAFRYICEDYANTEICDPLDDIACYRNKNVLDGDLVLDQECNTDPPPEMDPDDWGYYWPSCVDDAGSYCKKCSWGTTRSVAMAPDERCIPQ